MLEVQIENIIPVTEARDKFNQIVDAVEGTDHLYVMTKNGKPAAIMVGVHHLEKLTGEHHEAVFGKSEPSSTTPADPNVTIPPMQEASPEEAPAPAEPATPSSNISFDNVNAVSDNNAAPAATPNPVSDIATAPNPPAEDGQALAPDAITPAPAAAPAPTDPFAIPTEPLDLPEDKDIAPSSQSLAATTPPPVTPVDNMQQQPPVPPTPGQ